jgi:hydrogenase maturation protease
MLLSVVDTQLARAGDGPIAPCALIAGIGNGSSGDDTIGAWVVERLAPVASCRVHVVDASSSPLGAVVTLGESPRYQRVVFVAAVRRGRAPGAIQSYCLGTDDAPARTVAPEAADMSTALDRLLWLCAHSDGGPPDIRVVEVEPGNGCDAAFGFSHELEARLGSVLACVWTEAVTRPREQPISAA